jgi:hypothetical protein
VAAVGRANRSNVAVVLLLVMGARHYLYDAWPPELRGLASKALGALALLSMVWLVVILVPRSTPVTLVALWWSIEEVQVALCSFAYMVRPWPVPVGHSICSARLDLDLGAVGIVVIFWLAIYVYRSLYGRTTPRA